MPKNSDRAALEIASTLLSDYPKDRASFNTARLGALQKALASLGRTPVDRGRIVVPAPESELDAEWEQFFADS